MATVARKGCHSVRVHHEKKEALKAQKKEWELAGTNIGNIMGIQKKDDGEEVSVRLAIAIFIIYFAIFWVSPKTDKLIGLIGYILPLVIFHDWLYFAIGYISPLVIFTIEYTLPLVIFHQ